MGNCIFVNKSVSGSLHPLFSQVYLFAIDPHNYNTRFASNGLLKILTNDASIYGTKSFETSLNQIKDLIKNYFFNLHDNLVT